MEAVADLHLDLLQELLVASDEPNPFRSRWLPKLQAGGVRLQGCPVYVPAEESGESALRVSGPEDFPTLADAMTARGWSTSRTSGVLYGNALRFLGSALPDG